MIKKIIYAIIAIVAILLLLAGVKALQIRAMMAAGESMGEYPESVEIQEVWFDEWEVSLSAIGSVAATQGTVIRTEVEGSVTAIHFEAGSEVSAGDKLVQLDSEVEAARLKTVEAAEGLAKLNLERSRELFHRQSLSESELDTAEATYMGALAELQNAQAVLNKKTIIAPFSGRLGVKLISLGDYLNRGDSVVSLQSLEKVFVNFSISQQELSFAETGYTIRVKSDSWPDEVFEGKITAINPGLNPTTRTVEIQATLDNPESKLRPGMFVKIELLKPELRPVVFIPQSAVMNATYGNTVFVAAKNEDGSKIRAKQRIVRLGERRGDFVEIISGIERNEKVVTSGAFKLKDGTLISHSDIGVVEPSLNPEPAEG